MSNANHEITHRNNNSKAKGIPGEVGRDGHTKAALHKLALLF